MLNSENAQLLTQVGKETPMGKLMRAYWMPILMSGELPEPDCEPVRVRLLGEQLVAFRDSQGRVGLLEEHCPHRRASLHLGRNEGGGLRCVYHGWKFGVDGACLDLPSEPPESVFKHRIKAVAYPCVERGGVIWAYAGPGAPPPPPDFEWMAGPAEHRYISKRVLDCNWAQALEGDIDSSHASILHSRLNPSDYAQFEGVRDLLYFDRDRYPRYEVVDTDYGLVLAARRNAEENTYYWRATQYVMPVFVMIAPFDDPLPQFNMWIPMDDHTTMVWAIHWHAQRPLTAVERSRRDTGLFFHCTDFAPDPATAGGAWRPRLNASNNYGADRGLQRTKMFSSIEPLWCQDKAVQESMGPIADRLNEHLAPSDLAISRWRQKIIAAARAYGNGSPPAGLDPRTHRVRPVGVVLDRSADWKSQLGAGTAR
jgi:phenylpropionate dioxygenase-like ring-hydroxylating dioxygenase large terminal subunit